MSSVMTTRFHFRSMAVGDVFQVVKFHGEESISRPFRFEIELVSQENDIDLDALVGRPAFLELEKNGKTRKIHGVLAEFEQGGEGEGHAFFYRAVLVPRLWLLSLTAQNQIYQNLTVAQIVEHELLGQRANPTDVARVGLTSLDYEIRLTRNAAPKEYVVQFRESDLDFISRLMEHEGIFYFFSHDEEREKLVVGDNGLRFLHLTDNPEVEYRPGAGLAEFEQDAVQTLVCCRHPVPRKVVLKDYNYRYPHVQMQADANVDNDRGIGFNSTYGEHFKLPEEGRTLAAIRAEEIACRARVLEGRGTRIHFQGGFLFTLERHFRDDFNAEYLLTSVRHFGEQATRSGNHDAKTAYYNEFTCIPAEVPFRPERFTPKPKMYGIMNATIDASGSGDRAEIDDQGRYKVIMPFDLTGTGEGKASRYIRMAQPYGGSNNGMHFPLLKGTEVVWTCIDGDPDRPIIIGTVPNPLNKSVVTRANNTQNVIRTPSGILMEFNDGLAESSSSDSSSTTGNALGQSQMRQGPDDPAPRVQRLAQQRHFGANDPSATVAGPSADVAEGSTATFTVTLTVPSNSYPVTVEYEYVEGTGTTWTSGSTSATSASVTVNVPTTADGDTVNSSVSLRLTRLADNSNNATSFANGTGPSATATVLDQAVTASTTSTTNRRLKLMVPNYATDASSYLRMGTQDTAETLEQLGAIQVDGKFSQDELGTAPDGWFEYTKGDHTIKVEGDSRRILMKGTTDYTFNDSFEFGTGVAFSHFAGGTHESTSGMASSVSFGGSYEAAFGLGVSTSVGFNAEYTLGYSFDIAVGDALTLAKSHEFEADDEILLKVDPNDAGFEYFMENVSPWVYGTLAGIQAIWSPIMASGADKGLDASERDTWETQAKIHAGIAGLAYTSGLALAAAEFLRHSLAPDAPMSQLKLDRDSAELAIDPSPLPGTDPEAFIRLKHTPGVKPAPPTDQEIVIQCGSDASITLKKTGEVEIKGTQINFLVGANPMLTVKDNVWVQTGGLVVADGDLFVNTGAANIKTDINADKCNTVNATALGGGAPPTAGPNPQ